MSDETDKPAKATIGHKLANIDHPTIESKLVDSCVLKRVAVPESASQRSPEQQRLAKIHLLQAYFRYQMYNLITDEPHNRYEHTYALNCRPAGVWASPKTKFCTNPRICPWCFVRRQLVPMFKALDAVPTEKTSKLRLVG